MVNTNSLLTVVAATTNNTTSTVTDIEALWNNTEFGDKPPASKSYTTPEDHAARLAVALREEAASFKAKGLTGRSKNGWIERKGIVYISVMFSTKRLVLRDGKKWLPVNDDALFDAAIDMLCNALHAGLLKGEILAASAVRKEAAAKRFGKEAA